MTAQEAFAREIRNDIDGEEGESAELLSENTVIAHGRHVLTIVYSVTQTPPTQRREDQMYRTTRIATYVNGVPAWSGIVGTDRIPRPDGTPNMDRLRAWLDEEIEAPSELRPHGTRRHQSRPRARVRGKSGGLGYTGNHVNVMIRSAGTRNRYESVHERTLAEGGLELQGPNGRYVDWREVVPERVNAA